jgi:hypothetical protein
MNKFNPYPSHLSVTKDTRDEKKERLASPRLAERITLLNTELLMTTCRRKGKDIAKT